MEAPREDLIRMAPGVELRADLGEGRTLTGYAAVFNSDTVINSWEGQFIERIAPGAFKRTLKNNGDRVKVLFNHGMDPSIGDKPLGRATVLKEDERGLYVEVPLDDTSYNQDLIASLRSGAIDGMSFRFSVPEGGDTWDAPKRKGALPTRTINEIKLAEFGPVTFPAYTATEAGIRSRGDFTIWHGLSEEKRDAIRNIIGTPLGGSGSTTPPEGLAASSATDSEPSATTPRRITSAQVRARLLLHGVTNAQEARGAAPAA